MKEFFRKLMIGGIIIDVHILTTIERFCHWTQRTFGIASPSWQRLFLVLEVVALVTDQMATANAINVVASGMLIGVCVFRFLESLKREPHAGSELALNPVKFAWPGRLVGLFFAVTFLSVAWYRLDLVAEYFGACDDLPPGESKAKKWLKSLSPSPRLQEA